MLTRITLVAAALCVIPLALAGCSTASSSGSLGSAGSSGSSSAASPSSGVTGGGSGYAADAPKDMCALLSTDEATAAFGTTLATTYETDGTSCNYSGEDEAFITQLSPAVIKWNDDLKLLELDIDKTSPISGLGDQAAGNAKGIIFRKGSVIMDIEVSIGTDRTTEDQLVAAAKVMLSHLG